MGMHLPGPQSVYLQQTYSFLRPVVVGEEVTATAVVREFSRHKSLIWLDTVVTKAGDRAAAGAPVVCITGSALGMCRVVEFVGESPWTFVREGAGKKSSSPDPNSK
jgi:acyl dehydratase